MKHKILHQRAALLLPARVQLHISEPVGKPTLIGSLGRTPVLTVFTHTATHAYTPALTCDALRAGEWECEGWRELGSVR